MGKGNIGGEFGIGKREEDKMREKISPKMAGLVSVF